MKILYSGFGAFMNIKKNPSGQLAKYFNEKKINNAKIIGIVLPVTYESYKIIYEYIDNFKPEIIINTGVYQNNKSIRLEQVALNNIPNLPDVNGNKLEKIIQKKGPKGIITKLPLELLVSEDTKISQNAGNYVCNYVFYKTMTYLRNNKSMIGGFIHVPKTKSIKIRKPMANIIKRRIEFYKTNFII